MSGADFNQAVTAAYAEIVHWRQNLFLTLSGKAGKRFTCELALWYRRHFLPCVTSYPGFCVQDCYMCNNDSWLARGMCAPHTSSAVCCVRVPVFVCMCACEPGARY